MKNITSKAPNVPIKQFKRTKIIATVGPATSSYENILKLIEAGANGLRLNFSHGDYPSHAKFISWIRKASKAAGKPVAIIQDLQGPKIRLGDFEEAIEVKTGQKLTLQYKSDYLKSGNIPTQFDLSKKVKKGERLYIYDGKVKTIITNVKKDIVEIEVQNNGTLFKRKGINLPDTDFGGDIITKKDKADIEFGATEDIDYVALSFVQTADDIKKLRSMLEKLGSKAKVIAKIETNAAVENIEQITEASDAIMVARGDLAIETLPEAVPVVQRKIITLGIKYAKPTIVATQMLMSMTEVPEPTRAEISDIATAVILGADCVMLSDETAAGKYPIEAVDMMKRVILYTQENNPLGLKLIPDSERRGQMAISAAVITLAEKLNATAIIAETLTGATALHIASHRSSTPVIAVTSSIITSQQLALVYGVKSYVRPVHKYAASRLTDWLEKMKLLKKGDMVVTASGKYPGVAGVTDTVKVRIVE